MQQRSSVSQKSSCNLLMVWVIFVHRAKLLLICNFGKISRMVLADLSEMLRNGFSVENGEMRLCAKSQRGKVDILSSCLVSLPAKGILFNAIIYWCGKS